MASKSISMHLVQDKILEVHAPSPSYIACAFISTHSGHIGAFVAHGNFIQMLAPLR